MKMHYVWFDGTNFNIGDSQDLERFRDEETEVLFQSKDFEEASKEFDRLCEESLSW